MPRWTICLALLPLLAAGCKGATTTVVPPPVRIEMQTRQLYPGYVSTPMLALIPESNGADGPTLLGYGTLAYVLAGSAAGESYIFPLAAAEGVPVVTVEKGILAFERATIDLEVNPVPLTVAVDPRYQVAGINNWAVHVPLDALQGWSHPILHFRWQALQTNGQPVQKDLYFPLSK